MPLLWVLAALVASARGGMMIRDGKASPMPWIDLFTGALYDLVWWMPIGAAVVAFVRRQARWRAPLAAHVGAQLALGAASCTAYYLLRGTVRLPGDPFAGALGWRAFAAHLPSSVGMYLLLATMAGLFVLLVRAREREREAATLALRASRLETELMEAQLGVLRAQLHPHFLFNALHAVSTLVDFRPKDARRMLVRLSDLLRMALRFSERRDITLAQEMEWLEHYAELQGLRFGERLRVDLRMGDGTANALVPPLVLQPLVENAIKHAVEPLASAGHITVSAEREGRWLRVRVRDDGHGPARDLPHHGDAVAGGVGLRNTRARLRTLYGEEQQVVLQHAPGGGAEALVELPWHEANAGTGAIAENRRRA